MNEPWKSFIGVPDRSGAWIVWGESGSGKTTFTMQLCKEFATREKVLYNSLEEGNSKSIASAITRVGMIDVKQNFYLLDKESIEELKLRLSRKRSPKVCVIDSLQYSGLDYRNYLKLIEEFPKTLFIFISHADGKNPSGRTASKVRYDAMVKIRVEGYRAFAASRFLEGSGTFYDVWKEGAINYHGE
ncbi:MAG: hypothetical protein EP346_06875 [Bacteroidetes bacterium]|nr:MAG: hypothetical protein EP346_06875 [Bacteroidota bacterium]